MKYFIWVLTILSGGWIIVSILSDIRAFFIPFIPLFIFIPCAMYLKSKKLGRAILIASAILIALGILRSCMGQPFVGLIWGHIPINK